MLVFVLIQRLVTLLPELYFFPYKTQQKHTHTKKLKQSSSVVLFRDRAKERRQKYGLDDNITEKPKRLEAPIRRMVSSPKREHLPSPPTRSHFGSSLNSNETVKTIGGDNIGSRMLKAMGWVSCDYFLYKNIFHIFV